ncbi:hypothetical protein [Xenorhabdus szentirmaii]|uniref:Uncharacterized protein n=1 Tax=Xenorhabdus szentirmaii TaxID=290112 RepID=A0AAW3YYF2_9GAMM|nr:MULTISPECIES: hypothetical protein [Xenorhabdus]MBD2794289.1 hypothetical protein [Xenorhabdus sp. CUL]MBD2801954.1 hypothetical protein [Xenorhabdus sp. M]MBD2806929.1 hypothetical protein [Xenorhabdus sp. ZM]MBD2822311.1 hypothetical protein [Xenorhabdus sp. 42]MBD2826390.1 hypothetical protein [Xenorhabdus sp. 5]
MAEHDLHFAIKQTKEPTEAARLHFTIAKNTGTTETNINVIHEAYFSSMVKEAREVSVFFDLNLNILNTIFKMAGIFFISCGVRSTTY